MAGDLFRSELIGLGLTEEQADELLDFARRRGQEIAAKTAEYRAAEEEGYVRLGPGYVNSFARHAHRVRGSCRSMEHGHDGGFFPHRHSNH